MPSQKVIIERVEVLVKRSIPKEGSHDWFHIERVRNTALLLAKKEGADPFICNLAALTHDVDDWKYAKDAPKTPSLLKIAGADKATIQRVLNIISEVSFKGAGVKTKPATIEGQVVQDADRLDAIGAIGIARCFAYGGSKGKAIYDPKIKPHLHKTFKSYKSSEGTSINHFYEKLLLLKDRMNTKAGKRIAGQRHRFMQKYLKEFFGEVKGSL